MPFSKVEEWMQNDVKGTCGMHSIVFVLPRALEYIGKANLKASSEEDICQLIKGIKDATSDHRSRFSNTREKICCVRIPREVFSRDLLKQLIHVRYMKNIFRSIQSANSRNGVLT